MRRLERKLYWEWALMPYSLKELASIAETVNRAMPEEEGGA